METKKKNLNLNNVPEPLIRMARASAATEGKPLYAWAIDAFEKKINHERSRDPGSITERLVNAILALVGSGTSSERVRLAISILTPLKTTDFPAELQAEFSALMAEVRQQQEVENSETSRRIVYLLLKIWGPSWYK